ncbi:uncharacterized protein [Anoplolepis gracilipes]|uniref:uncharacterized protein n=1 Tax=Anoplolepis gracilipes TaxID=354296 RepID=UPI003BA3478E
MAYCTVCHSLQSLNHLCYMLPIRRGDNSNPYCAEFMEENGKQQQRRNGGENNCIPARKKSRVAFVFYDFETRQDETFQGTSNVKIHVPTLCVAHQICESCAEINETSVRCYHTDTNDLRYEHTVAMTSRLRTRGYRVIEKWECDFDHDINENVEKREYLQHHQMLDNEPLDPRHSFYGGRTENIVTRYEITKTKKIRYVDVCSLYPYVLKTGAFPIGHLTVYVGEECAELIGISPGYNFDSVEGIVRCRVLSPRNLFHPVLPYRVQGKLLFALCRACCETFSQSACAHEPSEREFEGTWISCELKKAIEKGYFVTEVSEIWQYNVTRYNHTTRQGGLLAGYINTFLQLKQEASGWPSECTDDDAKERYLCE